MTDDKSVVACCGGRRGRYEGKGFILGNKELFGRDMFIFLIVVMDSLLVLDFSSLNIQGIILGSVTSWKF